MVDKDLELEYVACNLCNSNSYELHLQREDLNLYLPGIFRLVKCKNCGLIYQNPRPSQNSWETIYPDEYDQYVNVNKGQHTLKLFIDNYGLFKRAKIISKYCKGGNLCDIGCSTGDFLITLQRFPQWNGYGVEPKKTMAEIANARRLKVHHGYFDEKAFPDIEFDCVTLWNTIEHLSDPSDTLSLINRRLNKGGLLIFNTPNLDSFDARFFGKYWIGYELPRHFFVFSENTIDSLLQKSGFNIERTFCFYGQHAAAMSSLRFYLRAQSKGKLYSLENILFSIPVKALLLPIFYLQDKIKKSSQISIIAKKT